MQETQTEHSHKFSFGMFLVALGIVYGDIGTSPMYVMKSIVEGNGGIAHVDTEFIVGSLSLVIWTITLLTTIKHVLIALRADNHGEGGIFALYSLIRDCGKWLIIPTMIGGCTMLADGVLTPAVTVTTAVEGLRSIEVVNSMLGSGQHLVVVITLAIISALFMIQRSGTSSIGKMFGPVMMLWFLFLGLTGLWLTFGDLTILRALNPYYAIDVLISPNNKAGFLILGSVFHLPDPELHGAVRLDYPEPEQSCHPGHQRSQSVLRDASGSAAPGGDPAERAGGDYCQPGPDQRQLYAGA